MLPSKVVHLWILTKKSKGESSTRRVTSMHSMVHLIPLSPRDMHLVVGVVAIAASSLRILSTVSYFVTRDVDMLFDVPRAMAGVTSFCSVLPTTIRDSFPSCRVSHR